MMIQKAKLTIARSALESMESKLPTIGELDLLTAY